MASRLRRWAAPLSGVAVGAAAFVGINVGTGRAVLPTVASVSVHTLLPAGPATASGPISGPPYQTVCAPCHQLDGQGLPFAFPPLAGSEWMTKDPETPIRIALLGMSGEIQVNGATFNLIMPPPPALSDAQLAEAITYARTNFGNRASAVNAEQVKRVRESLGARATPWTASELSALRSGGAAGMGAADSAAAGSGAAGSRVPAAR